MLLTYIAEIYLIIINYVSYLPTPFDDIFLFVKSSCALVSGTTNKSLQLKDRPTDQSTNQPIDQASEFAPTH